MQHRLSAIIDMSDEGRRIGRAHALAGLPALASSDRESLVAAAYRRGYALGRARVALEHRADSVDYFIMLAQSRQACTGTAPPARCCDPQLMAW